MPINILHQVQSGNNPGTVRAWNSSHPCHPINIQDWQKKNVCQEQVGQDLLLHASPGKDYEHNAIQKIFPERLATVSKSFVSRAHFQNLAIDLKYINIIIITQDSGHYKEEGISI